MNKLLQESLLFILNNWCKLKLILNLFLGFKLGHRLRVVLGAILNAGVHRHQSSFFVTPIRVFSSRRARVCCGTAYLGRGRGASGAATRHFSPRRPFSGVAQDSSTHRGELENCESGGLQQQQRRDLWTDFGVSTEWRNLKFLARRKTKWKRRAARLHPSLGCYIIKFLVTFSS